MIEDSHIPFRQVRLRCRCGREMVHSSRLKTFRPTVHSSTFPMSPEEIATWATCLAEPVRTVFNLNASGWDEDTVSTITRGGTKKHVISDVCSGEARVRAAEEHGVAVHHMPVEDGTATLSWLEEVVALAKEALARGAVLFHCYAGVGRSALCAAALCIEAYDASARDFPRHLSRLPDAQKAVLREFEGRRLAVD